MTSSVAETIANVLNEMLDADHAATSRLIQHKVTCNPEMASHDTIQVDQDQRLSPLGMLNGIALRGGDAVVLMRTAATGEIAGFEVHPKSAVGIE